MDGDQRHGERSLLRDSAYAAIGLGDALAEAVRSLPPPDEAVQSLRSWSVQCVESAGHGFERLVRRGRRTLGSAPLDQRPGWRPAPRDPDQAQSHQEP